MLKLLFQKLKKKKSKKRAAVNPTRIRDGDMKAGGELDGDDHVTSERRSKLQRAGESFLGRLLPGGQQLSELNQVSGGVCFTLH